MYIIQEAGGAPSARNVIGTTACYVYEKKKQKAYTTQNHANFLQLIEYILLPW